MKFLSIFENLSFWQYIAISLFSNIFLYLFSIGMYLFIERTCAKDSLQSSDYPFLKSDLYLSFLTVLLNSFVMLIGIYLWKAGWLNFTMSTSLARIILETLGIILLMDFLMYVFHYLAHLAFIYKLAHAKHHEHVSTNQLSLFVLHPIETLGFGSMMLFVFLLYSFSLYAISAYVIINLIWGTIGHLNREFFPSWAEIFFLGTTKFHNQHHLDQEKNFGFYTSIWDRLFRTIKVK